ncbi:MAG: hypothetical protein PHS37_05870 [Candidatus Omnitrophica bacterium]|nr:hypothetical protein [Candidatus Omnitrophota bacterium]
MGDQLFFNVIVPLIVTGICFVTVLVILIKDYSRIPPRGAIMITAENMKKLKEEDSRKDSLVARALEEAGQLKAEVGRLQAEEVVLRDELAAKSSKPLFGGVDPDEIKRLKSENERLKEEIVRFREQLASAPIKSMPDTNELEEMLLAKTEVDQLNGELKRVTEELRALKLKVAAGVQEVPDNQSAKAEADRLKAELDDKTAALAKKEEETAKLVSALERGDQDAKAEAGRLKAELDDKTAALAKKEEETAKLVSALERGDQDAKAEADRLKAELDDKTSVLAQKEAEIARLAGELERLSADNKNNNESITKLQSVGTEADAVEKALEEEKKSLQELKLRIGESRIKLQLLSDKAKENAELLAKFAQGKEFDEFRKSVHLDEIVQKYESEITALKLKNLELEKKLGSAA